MFYMLMRPSLRTFDCWSLNQLPRNVTKDHQSEHRVVTPLKLKEKYIRIHNTFSIPHGANITTNYQWLPTNYLQSTWTT
jgi:hypothetical protein